MIMANRVQLSVWGGGDYIIGANQAGKRACSLLSVTDDTETNKQNKSIATGLLYAVGLAIFALTPWKIITAPKWIRT